MGLFDSLLKKETSTPSKTRLEAFPDLYTGMKVEILTTANALIFVGRLKLLENDILEVRSETGGVLPRAVYNHPVKLRCFQKDGTALTLNGTVAQNSFDFWRIENLKYLQNSEHRNFYRQNTAVQGWAIPDADTGEKKPCKVLDISGGGARVVMEPLVPLGNYFRLITALLPDEEPFVITCQVTRVQERTEDSGPIKKFEYGCQFLDLSEREQDRLLQSIFALQRKILQARRDS